MTIWVREVRREDAAAVVALLNPIIEAGSYTILDEPITMEDQIEFIEGLPDRSLYLAAWTANNRELIGIQDVQPVAPHTGSLQHVGEISTFVSLGVQRAGTGSALMEATLGRAASLGYRKLMATIRADNPQAQGFYRAHGFQPAGILREHALVCGKYIDEVLMEKPIK